MLIDYDQIEDWKDSLGAVLSPHVPKSALAVLVAAKPKYVHEACDLILRHGQRDAIVEAATRWVEANSAAAYHGTRLTQAEVDSVLATGLRPLKATDRAPRLTRALSSHPRWGEVAVQLPRVLEALGAGGRMGRREGQVHLTLSRNALVRGFTHYLAYGSEFDKHAAQMLLGHEGLELLSKDGSPALLKVEMPGSVALAASNRYFTPEQMWARGELPNLVREVLQAWSFRVAWPEFLPSSLETDCGIRVDAVVPADWIVGVESI